MFTTCSTCHYFHAESTIDKITHEEHHRRWARATRLLSYQPMSYNEREEVKLSARELMKNETSISEKAEGASLIIRTWYDRDLESAISTGRVGSFPSFEKYLFDKNSNELPFPPEVIEQVKTMYAY